MRFRLQLITISDDGSELIHPVAELARGRELRPETTGLTLAEGKQILKQVQQVIVDEQVQMIQIDQGLSLIHTSFGSRIFSPSLPIGSKIVRNGRSRIV